MSGLEGEKKTVLDSEGVEALSEAIFDVIQPYGLTLCYYSSPSIRALGKEWPKIAKQASKNQF